MKIIQTGKPHFASALGHQSVDCVKRGKKYLILLSGHAISENKADRSYDLPTNNFSAHSLQLCVTWCDKACFPQQARRKFQYYYSNEQYTKKRRGQTLKPNLSSTSTQANKIRLGSFEFGWENGWACLKLFSHGKYLLLCPHSRVRACRC